VTAKPFHLAWFLQGSSVQAWAEPWTGHIGTTWEQPELTERSDLGLVTRVWEVWLVIAIRNDDFSISDAQIFVMANYVWGPDEAHYDNHRYIISAYVRKPSSILDDLYYYLEDRYMTVHKYDLDANADILGSEKQEILARLRRVKAETELQQKADH